MAMFSDDLEKEFEKVERKIITVIRNNRNIIHDLFEWLNISINGKITLKQFFVVCVALGYEPNDFFYEMNVYQMEKNFDEILDFIDYIKKEN